MALYKFQTANLNSLIAMKNRSLYFSPLNKLNDATEMMFGFSPGNSQADSEWIPDIEDLQHSSVLCMGSDFEYDELPTDLLMWTHYGAALSGVCLVFDEEMLIESFENQLCEFHQRVSYGHPKLLAHEQLISEDSGLESISGVDFFKENQRRMMRSFIFNKPKCFSYEHEYRFISKREGLMAYNPSSLKKIIIGSKIDSPDLECAFIEAARSINENIDVLHASVMIDGFKIHVE